MFCYSQTHTLRSLVATAVPFVYLLEIKTSWTACEMRFMSCTSVFKFSPVYHAVATSERSVLHKERKHMAKWEPSPFASRKGFLMQMLSRTTHTDCPFAILEGDYNLLDMILQFVPLLEVVHQMVKLNRGVTEFKLRKKELFVNVEFRERMHFDEDGCIRFWDLSGCKLKQLPELFGTLRLPNELSLEGNELESLPASFGGIETKSLSLEGNQLVSLPEGFGLKVSHRLNLSNNKLTSLPASFGDINCSDLDLSENELSSSGLPPNFCKIKVSGNLILYNNKFETDAIRFENISGCITLHED